VLFQVLGLLFFRSFQDFTDPVFFPSWACFLCKTFGVFSLYAFPSPSLGEKTPVFFFSSLSSFGQSIHFRLPLILSSTAYSSFFTHCHPWPGRPSNFPGTFCCVLFFILRPISTLFVRVCSVFFLFFTDIPAIDLFTTSGLHFIELLKPHPFSPLGVTSHLFIALEPGEPGLDAPHAKSPPRIFLTPEHSSLHKSFAGFLLWGTGSLPGEVTPPYTFKTL